MPQVHLLYPQQNWSAPHPHSPPCPQFLPPGRREGTPQGKSWGGHVAVEAGPLEGVWRSQPVTAQCGPCRLLRFQVAVTGTVSL